MYQVVTKCIIYQPVYHYFEMFGECISLVAYHRCQAESLGELIIKSYFSLSLCFLYNQKVFSLYVELFNVFKLCTCGPPQCYIATLSHCYHSFHVASLFSQIHIPTSTFNKDYTLNWQSKTILVVFQTVYFVFLGTARFDC